ncbi:hypothetical protein CDAR_199461 [Caerostris darwini]|uniref:sn-1-specific diacylglycerol lipase ABHD11 n=1 Tax=Caerostris darwini TaxID=1538125 RepID=A0AAV4M8D9_9ARAC|nr:hypothetical protein CDAR_199461 [Caerostris darwini]
MEAVELAYDVYESSNANSNLPPIIFLHGLFWNKFVYRGLVRKLGQATNRKIYSLDLRNHGESPFCEDCDIYLMCEDVKRFMKERNLHRVTFVCHSFSSTIAYLIALEKPDAVEKLVLVDQLPFLDFQAESAHLQVNVQNRILGILDPAMSLGCARAKLLQLAEMGTTGQKWFYKKAAYDLTKVDEQFKWRTDFNFLLNKYLQRAFTPKPVGHSEHEILIVRCPNSISVPDSKFAAALRHNPNAMLVTLEDTTHILILEKLDKFVEVVKEFLDEKNNRTEK